MKLLSSKLINCILITILLCEPTTYAAYHIQYAEESIDLMCATFIISYFILFNFLSISLLCDVQNVYECFTKCGTSRQIILPKAFTRIQFLLFAYYTRLNNWTLIRFFSFCLRYSWWNWWNLQNDGSVIRLF